MHDLDTIEAAIVKIETQLAWEALKPERGPEWKIKAEYALKRFRLERLKVLRQCCTQCGSNELNPAQNY
jgi:hypothetical protein